MAHFIINIIELSYVDLLTLSEAFLMVGNSRIWCEPSSRKIKGSRRYEEITRFCDACQCTYVGEAHLSSVAHLLETMKPVLNPGYGIPEWNKGYRILRKSGWNEFEGLGRYATGRRYPIKTVLKRDKLGLGCATFDAPKVTHFKVCALLHSFF